MFLDRREQFFTRMKNKYLTKCLCMTILSAMVLTSPLSVMAAEEDVAMSSEGDEFGGTAVEDIPILGTDTPTPDPGTDTPTPDPGNRYTDTRSGNRYIQRQTRESRYTDTRSGNRYANAKSGHTDTGLRDLMMEVKPHRQLHQHQINRQLHQRHDTGSSTVID